VHMADNLPPSSADVTESGSLNLPEHLICMYGVLMYMCCTECIDVCSVAGQLARSQNPEGPATGHLGTGVFSWFPCV
jgi:hypothetical protein